MSISDGLTIAASDILLEHNADGSHKSGISGSGGVHSIATTLGLGSTHVTAGLSSGMFLRAYAAASARFDIIYDADIPNTIVRTSRILTAGSGMVGGGNLSQDRDFSVVAGSGLTIAVDDISLTLPGTLSISTVNNQQGNHLHAITSSSYPGSTCSILATGGSGYVRLMRAGFGVDPLYPVHAAGGGTQARLEYDTSDWADLAVDSGGGLTISTSSGGAGGNLNLYPVGNAVFDPAGLFVNPLSNYKTNVGTINKKYLSLHVAEIWAETLVAASVMATIGGRVVVAPTTVLIADFPSGCGLLDFLMESGSPIITEDSNNLVLQQVNVDVKHNQMAANDIIYTEGYNPTLIDGGPITRVEFIGVTGAASAITGGFRYEVSRNLDGTGENSWYAGDALLNTGNVGNGFIDIYSESGVSNPNYSSTKYGPTLVGNVRSSQTYYDWTEHWALGNLINLYDYGASAFGFAAGKYSSSTSWVSIDSMNGLRIMRGTTQLGRWNIGGDMFLGTAAGTAGSTHVSIFNTAQTWNSEAFGTGDMLLGDNTANVGNVLWQKSTGKVLFRSGVTTKAYVNTNGAIMWGGGTGYLDNQGIWVNDASGSAAFGVSSINGVSWGGFTLDAGDVLIGRGAQSMWWDDSTGYLNIGASGTGIPVGGAANDVNTHATTISGSNIAASGITTVRIASNAIVTDLIASSAITSSKLTTGAIIADVVAAGAITNTKISASAITTPLIATNAIVADLISASAVTANKIATNTITTWHIAASAITADKIVTGAITAYHIAASAIAASNISVYVLDAISASMGVITAGCITGAITRSASSGNRAELNSSGFLIQSSGESSFLSKWKNSDITGSVDPWGFANLQKTDPDGRTYGVFNVGYQLNPTYQAGISFWYSSACKCTAAIITNNGASGWTYCATIDSTAGWVNGSQRKLKREIEPIINVSDLLNRFRNMPTYSYIRKDDTEDKVEFGVLAEEAIPEICGDVKQTTVSPTRWLGVLTTLLKNIDNRVLRLEGVKNV